MTVPNTTSLGHELAERLAALADHVGGGYPLVTVLGSGSDVTLLWQYEKQDIVVRCAPGNTELPPGIVPEEPLWLSAPSIAAAFELVRQTESLRQNKTGCPYLRFGPMPGTSLCAEFLGHDA